MTRSRFSLSFHGRLELDVVLGEGPPPDAQAVVVPQDVYLILGEVSLIEETREPVAEVWAALGRIRPRPRGTVLVSPGTEGAPVVLQAIVYDFEDAPHARPIHVFEALLAAFEEARRLKVKGLAVHPLGTAHQGLSEAEFVRLLSQVCFSAAEMGTTVRSVHVLVPSAGSLECYEALLRDLGGQGGGR